MAKMCPYYCIVIGFALDIPATDSDGRNWDFDDATIIERAGATTKKEEHLLIIGSPRARLSLRDTTSTTPNTTRPLSSISSARGSLELVPDLRVVS